MNSEDQYKAIIDTNLIISALIVEHSLPFQLLQAWENQKFTLLISPELLDEIKEVLGREELKKKYHFSTDKINSLLISLRSAAELVRSLPYEDLPFHCRDPKDNILLAAVFGGEASHLITGDKDILVLKEKAHLKGLHIVTVREFLSLP